MVKKNIAQEIETHETPETPETQDADFTTGEDLVDLDEISLLDCDLDNIPEEVLATDGEHIGRITSCKVKKSQKTGAPYISYTIEIEDEPEASTVFHMLSKPAPDLMPRFKNLALRNIRNFLIAFDIPVESWADEMVVVGKRARIITKIKNDPKYGARAEIVKFLAD